MMSNDLEARSSRANEVQSLLEEQTKSLLSVYLQNERSIESNSTPHAATRLLMLSDLVKDLLERYRSLDDASLLRMDWLCPLLTSCARSKDPSIQVAVQTILDHALKASDPENHDSASDKCNNDETVPDKVAEKIVADV